MESGGADGRGGGGVVMRPTAQWAIGAGVGALLLFLVFCGVLWSAGLFDFTGTDPSAKVVAASIAVVGGFFGSILAFAGALLTYSIQQRAEKRQGLEAVIRAVGLLTTPSGAPVSATQRAGVLFALESLEMLPMTLTMLRQMLATDEIDRTTAVQILDRGLCSGEDDVAVESATLLHEAAPKLVAAGGYVFPQCADLDWPTRLPERAREMIALARMRLTLSLPRRQWQVGDLFSHTAGLIAAWRSEKSERIKRDVGLFLKGLLTIYEDGGILYPPAGPVRVDEVRRELAAVSDPNAKPTALGRPLIEGLKEWLEAPRA